MGSKPRRKKLAPNAPIAKRSGTANVNAGYPEIHALKDNKFAKVLWDSASNSLVADIIPESEARNAVNKLHPPRVIPIRHDPRHVILYLWDPSKREYDGGETVSIDDPRLPRASER